MNIGVNVSFQTIVFSRYMPRSGITRSYDHSWNMITHMISHEIRRPFLLDKKAMTNLDSVLKSRDMVLQTKGVYSQGYGLPSGHVWLWELDCKEGRAPKNWCLCAVVLRRLLKVPWTARRSNQSILREINLGIHTGGTDAEVEAPVFWSPNENSWLIGKVPAESRRRNIKGWDG